MHSLTYLFVSVTFVQLQYLPLFFVFCYILFNKRQTLPVISLPFIRLDVKIPRKAKWTPQWLRHVTLLYQLLLFVQLPYWWQMKIRSRWKFIFYDWLKGLKTWNSLDHLMSKSIMNGTQWIWKDVANVVVAYFEVIRCHIKVTIQILWCLKFQ
jgi:hypothetical protein